MTDDWMAEVKGRVPHRPKRRWWAVAARPAPQMPLDVITTPGVTAVAAYGLRQMRARYVGPAINVQRSSDSATMDIGFRGAGALDVQTLANFIGGGTGSILIWYDQSANGYNMTVGAAPAPPVNLTGVNGLPTSVFVGGTNYLTNMTPVLTQPFTVSTVAKRTGNFSAYGAMVGDGSSAQGFYFNNAPNGASLYAGGSGATTGGPTCTDGIAHSMIALFNGISSTITVDAAGGIVGTSTAPGTSSFTGLRLGYAGSGGLTGNLSEAAFWSGQVDAGSIIALAANQKAYWGTP